MERRWGHSGGDFSPASGQHLEMYQIGRDLGCSEGMINKPYVKLCLWHCVHVEGDESPHSVFFLIYCSNQRMAVTCRSCT